MSGRGVAFVTGGSRGIGRAICLRLAADGYAIAVNYASSDAAAREVAASIVAAGGRASAIRADVADAADLARAFTAAERELGPLAVLVNNAGMTGPQAPLAEQDPAALARLVGVNVLGTLYAAREALRRMSTQRGGAGGAIVNLSSVAARTGGLAGLASYAATKGAIESLTRGLGREAGPHGVRVVAVAPGVIETDMTAAFDLDAIAELVPLGRVGRADDVAETVAWLVSPAAAYITGESVTVSGGR